MTYAFGLLLSIAVLGLYLALSGRIERLLASGRRPVWQGALRAGRPPVWRPEGVRALLREAGYQRVSVGAFYGACAGGAAVGMLLGNLIAGGVAVVMAAGAVGGALVPFYVITRRAEEMARQRRQQFAEAVETMRGLVRVGYGLERSLEFLAESGPVLMRPVMGRALAALRTGSLRAALEEMREQVASYDGDRLALALHAAATYGGRNVGAVLENLARAVREDLLVRREAEAEMARQELAARIIGGMPIVVLAAMFRFSPEYAAVYREPLGQGVLALMFVLIGLGYVLMRRSMSLPQEGRLAMELAAEEGRP
jgi:tight adherence protein B